MNCVIVVSETLSWNNWFLGNCYMLLVECCPMSSTCLTKFPILVLCNSGHLLTATA